MLACVRQTFMHFQRIVLIFKNTCVSTQRFEPSPHMILEFVQDDMLLVVIQLRNMLAFIFTTHRDGPILFVKNQRINKYEV